MANRRRIDRSSSARTVNRRVLLAAVAVESSLGRTAAGAEAVWSGGDGLWSDVSRWSTGVRPDDYSTDVIIDGKDGVASRVEFDGTGHARYLALDEGDTFAFKRMGIGTGFRLEGRVIVEPGVNGSFLMGGGTIEGGVVPPAT